jgi:DNA polymerase-3 subunit gamma/tau
MNYQVSARKWRPQNFEEVIGQQHIARTLTNAIRQKRIAHSYLFSGMRGVGKTTMARILAKALNCLSNKDGPTPTPCNVCIPCTEITQGISVDVVEIDGASNTSVEDVRSLRETIKYLPLKGRYKTYIIDEVHMLSTSAFNALLKTLEEPPGHVVFIFATTEANKIPSTILSRCQHFIFTRIKRKEMIQRLAAITQADGINVSERGLAMIAKASEGSLRDALSILDQASAYAGAKVQEEDLGQILGIVDQGLLTQLIEAILRHDPAQVLDRVKLLHDQGYDPKQFFSEMVEQTRNLLVYKLAKSPEELIDLPDEELQTLRKLADLATWEQLQQLFSLFLAAQDEIRGSLYPHFTVEMMLVRASRLDILRPIEDMLAQLDELQKGNTPSKQPPKPSSKLASEQSPRQPPNQSSDESPGDQDSSYASQKTVHKKINPPEKDVSPPPEAPLNEPGHQAAPSNHPSMSSDEIINSWEETVHKIKEARPNLGSYLEQGVVTHATYEKITLGYPAQAGFLTDLILKPDNRKFINDTLSKIFLKPPVLEIRPGAVRELAIKSDRDLQGKQTSKPSDERPLSPIPGETLSDNARVQEVLQIFGGQVIELKKEEG